MVLLQQSHKENPRLFRVFSNPRLHFSMAQDLNSNAKRSWVQMCSYKRERERENHYRKGVGCKSGTDE